MIFYLKSNKTNFYSRKKFVDLTSFVGFKKFFLKETKYHIYTDLHMQQNKKNP